MQAKEVDCYVSHSIPTDKENILTDFDFNIPNIHSVGVYFREPEACPFARGNWLIDIHFIDDTISCIKLPKEMSEEQVMSYIKPLINILEDRKTSKTVN
jgi:hypothetical protein